jgi:hypothetical protein
MPIIPISRKERQEFTAEIERELSPYARALWEGRDLLIEIDGCPPERISEANLSRKTVASAIKRWRRQLPGSRTMS